ncbi:unnamed protein product [Chrysodeixis includens]|uniref:Uncharacterized protein n=1 Tax=Chrysodeixis includens TaxID=689277 RepID=A0A9P0BTW6_CHRIL|nr:unnamed protein product [Chrysodeixis includens]
MNNNSCKYYMERTLGWMLNNKTIVILSLLSFSLFVSTLAIAGQRNRAYREIEELKATTVAPTQAPPAPVPETTPAAPAEVTTPVTGGGGGEGEGTGSKANVEESGDDVIARFVRSSGRI